MNEAHIHLVVNHFPLIGLVIGLLVLIAGFITKNSVVKTTALAIFIFAALTTLIAFYTGEGAEEVVEKVADVSHELIHEHEEYAEKLYLMNMILGLFALVTLWFQVKKAAIVKYAYLLICILAIASLIVGGMTGNTGGEIRHTEIRTIE